MTHVNTAYQLGAHDALQRFEKTAAGGEVLTPAMGALHPAFAAIAAGLTADKGRGLETGSGAGYGSYLGNISGGLGGALLGGLGGYGLGRLRGKEDDEMGQHVGIGAGLGALLGSAAGGAYGAHKGRQRVIEGYEAEQARALEKMKELIAAQHKED